MAAQITNVDVWAGDIEDRPGGLSDKLGTLWEPGANLEFVIARRIPENPGYGVVFLAPLLGAVQTQAAGQAGLSRAMNLRSLRLEAPDKPGEGAEITRAIAAAGISIRGFSAATIGRRSVTYFAFDTDADAQQAGQVLKHTFAVR
jgi:hypothetical protein